jgi:TonB family protein
MVPARSAASSLVLRNEVVGMYGTAEPGGGYVETSLEIGAGNRLKMNLQKLLCVGLMCFGFSLVYAAAQTRPAAGPPAAAPTTNHPPVQAAAAPLPDPKTPEEFFARARQLSDLEASGVPFHLKATYVASGDTEFTGNGTYEEWWQSKDRWRKEATLGDFRYVAINNGGTTNAYTSSDYVPLRLRQAMGAIEIGNSFKENAAKKWQMQKKAVSGVELTVISAKFPIAPSGAHPPNRVDYFTAKGILRIFQSNGTLTLYNNWQPFQNLLVSRSFQVISGKDRVLDISIDSLETLDPENKAKLPVVPDGLHAEPYDDGQSAVVPPRLEYRPLPDNPTFIPRGEKPMVLIGVTIDQNGNLREPYIEESAGSFLDHVALNAFRRFRFKQATLNGRPIAFQISYPYIFINESTP